MQPYKVIIAGSRNFTDYRTLEKHCNKILGKVGSALLLNVDLHIEIVSGMARGADSLGERYADKKGYRLKRFPANWNKHGKAAGHIRNQQMAEYGDILIAFWDGKSKGTKSMIEKAEKQNLSIFVYNYIRNETMQKNA